MMTVGVRCAFVAMLLLVGCAEQTQHTTVDFNGKRPPPDCPRYSAADLTHALAVLREFGPPTDDDIEPFVVLASTAHPFVAVTARQNGAVTVVDEWLEGDDAALYLLAQPGDFLVGDFVYSDTALKRTTLVRKQAIHLSGCSQ